MNDREEPTDWKEISIDSLLNFSGGGTDTNFRFNRIMSHRLKESVSALTDTIYKAHQGIKEKADELYENYKTISDKQSKVQNRLQWIVIALTLVLAASTVAYTWITWESVSAMRDANEIQWQFLEKGKATKAP